jgi:hypothetical protein
MNHREAVARYWHRVAKPLPEQCRPVEGPGEARPECKYRRVCLTYAVQSRWPAMSCHACKVRERVDDVRMLRENFDGAYPVAK